MAILDEAVNMPIPFNVALCSTGSSAQASEDFSSIEAARNSLGDLVKVRKLRGIWTQLYFSVPENSFIQNMGG
jgi:hypothetical protein